MDKRLAKRIIKGILSAPDPGPGDVISVELAEVINTSCASSIKCTIVHDEDIVFLRTNSLLDMVKLLNEKDYNISEYINSIKRKRKEKIDAETNQGTFK